jgi:hypothetical protein
MSHAATNRTAVVKNDGKTEARVLRNLNQKTRQKPGFLIRRGFNKDKNTASDTTGFYKIKNTAKQNHTRR